MRALLLLAPFVAACVSDPVTNPGVDGGRDAATADDVTEASAPEAGVDAGPSTVTGRIIDANGQPVANASLRIGAQGGPTQTTNTMGAFTILAPPTYDVSVVAKGSHDVVTYVGLSRRDPILTLPSAFSATSQVSFSGKLPGAIQQSLGPTTFALAVNGSVTWGYASTPSANQYAVSGAPYFGVQNSSGRLFVLQASNTSGDGPYVLGTSQQVGVVNLASFNNIDLMPIAPSEGVVLGTVMTGGGGLSGLRKQITLSPGVGIQYAFDGAGTSFNTKFPTIAGATFGVIAVVPGVPGAGGVFAFAFAGGLKANNSISLAVPPPPLPTSPADNALGVQANAATLAWGGQGTSVVELRCGTATFTTITKGQQAPIADAPDLGVVLPPGGKCNWSVRSLTAFTDPDDMAKDGMATGRPSMPYALIARTGGEIESPARSFTLK